MSAIVTSFVFTTGEPCEAARGESAQGAQRREQSDRLGNSLRELVFAATTDESSCFESLIHNGFRLDSLEEGQFFGFESYGIPVAALQDKEGPAAQRVMLESDGDLQSLVSFGPTYLPECVISNSDMFLWGRDTAWRRLGTKWAYVVDRSHFSNFMDEEKRHRVPQGSVFFDLGEFLAGAMGQELPKVTWCTSTRSMELSKKVSGTRFWLRFRSPNDAERFGCSLREIFVRDRNGNAMRWFSFLTGYQGPLRQNLRQMPRVAETVRQGGTKGLRESWQLLSGFKQDDVARGAVDRVALRDDCERVAGDFERLQSEPPQNPTVERQVVGESFTRLVAQLRKAQAEILETHAQEDPTSDCLVDDPVIRWRAVEVVLGPDVAGALRNGVFMSAKRDVIDTEWLIRLCDELGSLGLPPEQADPTGIRTDPALHFIAAILNSHWQIEVTPSEVEACVVKVGKVAEGSVVSRIAIETMIRIDEIEKIPEEKLAAWFQSEVIRGDRGTRTRAFRILSLTPNAQRYLMQRAADQSLDASVRAAIVEMLAYRAEATVRTKRFDFLSEADCQKILAMKRTSR